MKSSPWNITHCKTFCRTFQATKHFRLVAFSCSSHEIKQNWIWLWLMLSWMITLALKVWTVFLNWEKKSLKSTSVVHKQPCYWRFQKGTDCSFMSYSHPAEMSSPQGSSIGGWEHLHSQLKVLFFVMFTTLKCIVVELNCMCFCGVGGWSLYMDLLHSQLKVQYTLKLEPRCTTGPLLDQMTHDFSPKSRNDDLYILQHNTILSFSRIS